MKQYVVHVLFMCVYASYVCLVRHHQRSEAANSHHMYGIYYPARMRRGKVIGLSVRLSVCPSVHLSVCPLSPRKSPDLDI